MKNHNIQAKIKNPPEPGSLGELLAHAHASVIEYNISLLPEEERDAAWECLLEMVKKG